MILERRVIIFPRADFLDAMRRYASKIRRELPPTAPERLTFDPALDTALTIRFPSRFEAGSPVDFAFSREDVGKALTEYCIDRKVPIPGDAEKKLEKYKDGAALMIQMGSTDLHVMVIDDQSVMRNIIKKLLARVNIDIVTEAENGEEALLMLEGDCDPDVIICDLHMEKMDGIEFLRRLRADKVSLNCHKPVLILTGDKSERLHEDSRQVGASKILTKPISPEDLAREIALVRGYYEVKTQKA